jgi:hypothetical protein
MRRKSDRTKEKEKSSPEKKPEKATRRSRRHSRRRKRSSSVSEHDESATEENETSLKGSQDVIEEEKKDKKGKEETDQDNTDVKERNVQDETPKISASRRKKQVTDGTSSKTEEASPGDDDWKEDRSFWEGEEGKVSIMHECLQLFLKVTCLPFFHWIPFIELFQPIYSSSWKGFE